VELPFIGDQVGLFRAQERQLAVPLSDRCMEILSATEKRTGRAQARRCPAADGASARSVPRRRT
jgi:hypothetical protein